MAAIARMRSVVLDCPNPRALANFYRGLVGGDITYADDEWANLRDGDTVLLSFQRVLDYRPPDWPTGQPPQQFHIDVTVQRSRRQSPECSNSARPNTPFNLARPRVTTSACTSTPWATPSASAGTDAMASVAATPIRKSEALRARATWLSRRLSDCERTARRSQRRLRTPDGVVDRSVDRSRPPATAQVVQRPRPGHEHNRAGYRGSETDAPGDGVHTCPGRCG